MCDDVSTLDTALTKACESIGCPWYVDMIVECASSEKLPLARDLLLDSVDDDWTTRAKKLLVDECGVSPRDAEALVDEVLSRASDERRARYGSGDGSTMGEKKKTIHGDARDYIRGARGIYDEKFLELVEPLYDLHMGVENMGPLLYALCRFVKPRRILEVGAGYTSIFLLQALVDNEDEIERYHTMIERDAARLGDVPWAVNDYDYSARDARLHIVDNCAHEHTTAHKVTDIAETLGYRHFLHVHITDAFDKELPSTLAVSETQYFDLLWIDLGAANRIEGFFEDWWHRVDAEGGLVIVHSTLTNSLSRVWLERMRRLASNGGRDDDGSTPFGPFVTISFLEPCKVFQNSCSIFQKRGGAHGGEWTERVLTKYP